MITSITDAKKIRPPPCTGLLVLLAARVVADVIVLSYVVVAGALAPACFLHVDSTAHRPQRHRPNEGKRDRMLTRIGGPRSRDARRLTAVGAPHSGRRLHHGGGTAGKDTLLMAADDARRQELSCASATTCFTSASWTVAPEC